MANKFNGHSFDFDDSALEVTEAVIRKDHISIDWIEEGERGHLDATSEDGEVYRGHFGYPRPETNYSAELRIYRAANGDRVLFGRWRWADGNTGCWLFRLSPVSDG